MSLLVLDVLEPIFALDPEINGFGQVKRIFGRGFESRMCTNTKENRKIGE